MLRKTAFALLLVAVLPACSMISSEHLDALNEPVREGAITYSLPMTLLRLVVVQYSVEKSYDIAEFKSAEACKTTTDKLCSEVLTIPDPHHSYIVRFTGSPLSDDTLALGVNDQGYLSSADGLAVDRTGDILVAVAKLESDIAGPRALADTRGTQNYVLTLLVDPHDPNFMDHTNRRLAQFDLAISCGGACGPAVGPIQARSEKLYYRHKRTIFLKVTDRSGNKIKNVHPLLSFNGSPLIAHRIERAPFITRQTKMTYSTEGMATKVVHDKPSEVLGFVTAAGNLVGAIIAAPVNAVTKQATSTKKQTEYLESREKLLKQQSDSVNATTAKQSGGAGRPLADWEEQRRREEEQKRADSSKGAQGQPTAGDVTQAGTPAGERSGAPR